MLFKADAILESLQKVHLLELFFCILLWYIRGQQTVAGWLAGWMDGQADIRTDDWMGV